MKKRVKTKWLKALRSGDYPRTTGQLRDENGFCCLGVLCNIHAQEHPELAVKETSKFSYMDASGHLPPAVVEWAGLRDVAEEEAEDEPTDVKVTYRGQATTLVNLNDTDKLSFKQIANVIERCL
jgi:hypothetical protein